MEELIVIICRCCGNVFYMCRRCFRNHAYCSNECRISKQRELHRERQKKYRQTKEGKLNHQDDEKRRREKKKNTNMDDDTTRQVLSCCIDISNQIIETVKAVHIGKIRNCNKCGISGKVVLSFPRRDYRKRK